jgi:membrane protein DedA with SNARE-associated domain
VEGTATEPGRRRIPLPYLLAPIVAMSVIAFVADIIGPGLINERPLLQMFLNPRNRYLLLAAPQVEVIPFFVVGFFRLVLTDPIYFVLGVQYGDAALRWAETRMGDGGGFIRTLQRWFGRAAPVLIVLAPNGYLCLLAGASGMRARTFITLNVVGTLGRLTVFRLAGDAFREQLEDILGFVQRNQKWLIAVSFAIVAWQVFRAGGVESVSEIEEEIDEAERQIQDEHEHEQEQRQEGPESA